MSHNVCSYVSDLCRYLFTFGLSFIFFFLFFVLLLSVFFFFFQAEDGIRDADVTGVQTCALPISLPPPAPAHDSARTCPCSATTRPVWHQLGPVVYPQYLVFWKPEHLPQHYPCCQIGRASCRERV